MVPVGGTRPQDGAQGFNLVHVYDETVVHSVVPLAASEALQYVDAEESQRRLRDAGVVMPASRAFSGPVSPPTTPLPILR